MDISSVASYPDHMKKSMSTVVHGIERFLGLMPEPLVLRALESPTRNRTRS